jgi:hypothetical protein
VTIDEIREKHRKIRRTAEAVVEICEQSGCKGVDVLAEVALLLAFQRDLARPDALDMVNRAHNRVTYFLQMVNYDGYFTQMRAEIEAAQETEGKSFRRTGATV